MQEVVVDGYYGGGSGYHSEYSAGGGGGSSFISGYVGCNAISENSTSSNIIHTGQEKHYSGLVFLDGKMIEGNLVMPSHANNVDENGNRGNGFARITYSY